MPIQTNHPEMTSGVANHAFCILASPGQLVTMIALPRYDIMSAWMDNNIRWLAMTVPYVIF